MKYYSMNDYCREHFGKKLYKLSLDGGFTCPNRDGKISYGGCIFCSAAGSGDFAERGEDISLQLERAKKRIEQKNKNGGYIAYFQSFTNTYAPAEVLRGLFTPVILRDDIDVLSVATRPDCLEDDKIELLSELNKIKPVWVELGLQTVKKESADFIRRGYETPVYDSAVKKLRENGIYVITHMIIGLPGENIADMKNTLAHITACGSDGVKLQLLHVLSGTALGEMYMRGEINVLTEDEYMDILRELIPMLPEKTAVHRITGDGNKKYLLAPMWSADKKEVINRIKRL